MGKISAAIGKPSAVGMGGMDEAPSSTAEPDKSGGELSAAKVVLSAVNSGSAEKLASALKSFIKICGGY